MAHFEMRMIGDEELDKARNFASMIFDIAKPLTMNEIVTAFSMVMVAIMQGCSDEEYVDNLKIFVEATNMNREGQRVRIKARMN